jgi:hypothetical protein
MKLTVTNVDKKPQPSGVLVWMVKFSVERDPDEKEFDHRIAPEHNVFIHAFPEQRILAIIAEYELDESDMDSVMDMVLAEPFLDTADGEPTLFSGESMEVIRDAHIRRCARAKLRTRMSTRGIRNPVEMVRSVSIDLQEMSVIKKAVRDGLLGRTNSG